MSRYLHLARQRGLASSGPLRGPSLVSGKAQRRGLSARDAAQLLRYDWAHPEPGIDQDEFFDDQFERRAHEIQRTPSGQSALSIVPQKTGPWTGFNQLGQEKEFAPDANRRQTILKMDEWGFPERWTVMLGSVYDVPDPNSSDEQRWSVRANITVGAGGAIQDFYVDWMEGTVFSVCANAILINALYSEFDDTFDPINLRLRATVCRGDHASSTLPTVTEDINALAGSSSDGIRIPPFARSFSLIPRLGTAAAPGVFATGNRIIFSPTFGNTFPTASFLTTEILTMGNRAPIPAVSRFLIFDNVTASDVFGKVVFHIEP